MTITLAHLEEQMEGLMETIATFKAQEDKPTFARWKPNDGGTYYFVDAIVCPSRWNCSEIDFSRYALDNVFETKSEAQQVLDRQRAKVRVIDRLRELDGGNDEVTWEDASLKYFPVISGSGLVVDFFTMRKDHSTEWYTLSIGAWEQVIKEMPDDVRLALVGD